MTIKKEKKTIRALVIRLMRLALLFYVLLAVFAYIFSDRMIFYPRPSSYTKTGELITITPRDGKQICALYLENPDAEYTILYSHGNAEDLGDIRPTLEKIYSRGFSVFAYDYQGYGLSKGKPSEKGAYRDVRVAHRYLMQELNVPSNKIIAMGRSVGTGAAVDLASKEPVAGLITINAFTTAFRVVTGVNILPFDKFENIDKIKNVTCPVLMIHGTEDELIAFSHSQKLYEQANQPKFFLRVEGAGHNDDMSAMAGKAYGQKLDELMQAIKSK